LIGTAHLIRGHEKRLMFSILPPNPLPAVSPEDVEFVLFEEGSDDDPTLYRLERIR